MATETLPSTFSSEYDQRPELADNSACSGIGTPAQASLLILVGDYLVSRTGFEPVLPA